MSGGPGNASKSLLGRLPGEPSKRSKPSGKISLPEGTPPLAVLQPREIATLMGNKTVYPDK